MIYTEGLLGPETPRLSKENEWYAVEMGGDPGSVVKLSPDGSTFARLARRGRPNGLVVDQTGKIWIADTHPDPSLVLLDVEGKLEVFTRGPADEPFLFPNDLCFGPDGLLYMTDSGILLNDWAPGGQLRPDWDKAKFDGRVYQINLETGDVKKLDSGIKFTNGIAIGPDGHLYANEMVTGDIFKYELKGGGYVGPRQVYGNSMAPDWKSEGFRGPDGMAFGADGRLYVAMFGQADVTVLDTSGKIQTRMPTEGQFPTNVAFGPDGEKRIYVTEAEKGRIERFDVDQRGARVYLGET